jgi:hypothetical protein
MKKLILKHLTVSGYVKGIDLSDCESLTKNLEEAQNKMTDAKKNVKIAKQELNHALEDSIKKIENKKKAESKMQKSLKSPFTGVFNNKEFKGRYKKKLMELERIKNEMKKKLEEYKSDGTEKWDLFKRELTFDLEEIEKAVKNFMDYNKKKVKKMAS